MELYLIFMIFLNMVMPTFSYALNDSVQLMSDMLTGYDKRHRPIQNQSQPVVVNVTFDVLAIQEFDEVKEKFSVLGILYLHWNDEKVAWNSTLYGGIQSQLFRVIDIWYPVLILANTYDKISDIGDDWMMLRILSDGLAYFEAGSVFKSTCSVDVTFYPFDKQMCTLMFVPIGYNYREITIQSPEPESQKSLYSENGEWKLTNMSISVDSHNTMIISFHLKRKPLFLVVNIILPIIFMAAINSLVFLLPPESGERVSYSMTLLLAFAVLLTLVGDNLPKTSEPMSILAYFLMGVVILSTLMCVVTIMNLRVYFTKPEVPIPNCYVSFTRAVKCVQATNTQQNYGNNFQFHPSMEANTTENENNETKTGANNNIPCAAADDMNVEDDHGVTWKDVSLAVDTLCFIVFTALTVIATATFVGVLAGNA